MFVKMIVEENPENREEDIETVCEELIMVKDAIEKLDGSTKTAVILKRDENNYMIIGSGLGNKYVVSATVNGKSYSMSSKFDVKKEDVELIVAGRKRVVSSNKYFTLEMVLQAAKHFADRGALAQTFNWDKN